MATGKLCEFDSGLINKHPIKLVFPLHDLLDLHGFSHVTAYALRRQVTPQLQRLFIVVVTFIHNSLSSFSPTG
jgi:hypothetical protein